MLRPAPVNYFRGGSRLSYPEENLETGLLVSVEQICSLRLCQLMTAPVAHGGPGRCRSAQCRRTLLLVVMWRLIEEGAQPSSLRSVVASTRLGKPTSGRCR